MSSRKEQETAAPSEIAKFYRGKSLFITGAAGFLGVVLLETFLRCCPDIRRIYILLRSKKGVKPEDRKDAIFKKEIFTKLKEKDPDAFDKVIVVSGDVTQDDLGMNEADLLEVTQKVSVVFHCAAAISFLKPVSFMISQNVTGTQNVIELCRKIKNLEALVYTSTAFSNCNRKSEIEEKVYTLPFSTDEVLRLTTDCNNDELNRLYLKCKPEFPNYYTFSKCIAENFIAEKASDLPVAIVRPSIIVCTLKGPMPGFIEYGSGIVSLSVGIGKGFIRAVRVDGNKRTDHVPVDVVANTHIVAAYFQASESLPSPYIYNCTSGEQSPYTWKEFIDSLMKMVLKDPLPKSYQRPAVTMCKSEMKYNFFSVLDHYIPAIIIDILLWISGSKLRLYKLYQFYDKNMKALEYFTLNEWDFKSENFRFLQSKMNSTDAEMFYVGLKEFNLEIMTKNLRSGAPVYRRNKDSKPIKESLRTAYLRTFFTSFIKWSVLGGIASILYIAIF